MTTDPHTDWGPLAAAAFAHVRALQHRPAVDPQTDLDNYRAAEQRTRAREEADDAAEVIAHPEGHEPPCCPRGALCACRIGETP